LVCDRQLNRGQSQKHFATQNGRKRLAGAVPKKRDNGADVADTILAIIPAVTYHSAYGLWAALLMLGSAGCRDTQPSRAQTPDTPLVQQGPTVSTGSADSGLAAATAANSAIVDDSASPANVIRRYYDAIQRRQYDTAYALWGQSGKASGKTRGEFASGFAGTVRTNAMIGDSVRVEGAAGSQYATIPVTVDAVLRNGTRQHFVGTYTVRRAMVDGATPEQRRWHIYSAHLQQR
jgi:hypothetical protein